MYKEASAQSTSGRSTEHDKEKPKQEKGMSFNSFGEKQICTKEHLLKAQAEEIQSVTKKSQRRKMNEFQLIRRKAHLCEKKSKREEHTRRSKHAQKQARAEANMRAKANARAGAWPRDVALGAREDFTIFSPHGPPAVGTLPTVC